MKPAGEGNVPWWAERKQIMNFNEATVRLGNKERRKLENNTWLEKIGNDEIGVRLHNTVMVRFHRNGSIKVYSGGWHSCTTKKRINKYTKAGIHQKKYVWWLGNGNQFQEGAEVGEK